MKNVNEIIAISRPKTIPESGTPPIAACLSAKSIEKLTGKPILETATKLSTWMKNSGSMLSISPERLVSLIEGNQYVVLISNGQVMAGCGITLKHTGKTESGKPAHVEELGGLVVSPNSYKQGFGKSVLMAAIFAFNDSTLITYPNEQSKPLFEELGARVLSEEETIALFPTSVYNVCVDCPMGNKNWNLDEPMRSKIRRCCDRPYVLPKIYN